MRRLLLAVLATLSLARMEAASACSYAPGYRPPSDEDLFAKASAVFVGHLVRIEEVGIGFGELRRWPMLEGTFRVVEVFKGEPPADGKIRAPRYFLCTGPMLFAGFDYVFFLNDDNLVRSHEQATFVYDPPDDDIVGARKRLLDKYRALSKTEPK
jgi:hypothetical protein